MRLVGFHWQLLGGRGEPEEAQTWEGYMGKKLRSATRQEAVETVRARENPTLVGDWWTRREESQDRSLTLFSDDSY